MGLEISKRYSSFYMQFEPNVMINKAVIMVIYIGECKAMDILATC